MISVYFGRATNRKRDTPSNYRLEYNAKIIEPDTSKDEFPFLWGAHIANDIYWTPDVEIEKTMTRKNNSCFQCCTLVETTEINPRQEILVNYNLCNNN